MPLTVHRPLIALVAAASVTGCLVSRPDDAYDPSEFGQEGPGGGMAQDTTDREVDVVTAPDVPGLPAPGGGAGDTSGDMNGDQTGLEQTEDPATPAADPTLSGLVGQYLLRVDANATLNDPDLGTIDTTISTYSMAQLYLDPSQQLTSVEKQCYIRYDHRPRSSSTSMTTRVNDLVPQTTPSPRRIIDVDTASGAWSSRPAPIAVGWDWDFTDGAHATPNSMSDPLLLDPDRDGVLGITLFVSASSGIRSANCEIYLAQTVDIVYEGTLQGGQITGGTMNDNNSVSEELGTSNDLRCSSNGGGNNSTPGTNLVRFAPAPAQFDAEWTCPTEGQFASTVPL